MPANTRDVFRSLVDKQIVLPYLKNAMLAENWPEHYQVTIDSRPYYGMGDGYFHPSTHGLMDARRLYYQFHPEHRGAMIFEPHDLQAEMTLAMGSALHGVIQTQFQMAGLLREENVEREFIIKEHHVRGRTDMVIDHPTEGELPIEFKTQNSRAYDFQKEMKDFWKVQLSMALYGLGYDKGVLLVLESGFPYRMREFVHHRDDKLLAEVFEKFDYVRDCIARNEPPPHCCAKGSAVMKACPARYRCWLADQVARKT